MESVMSEGKKAVEEALAKGQIGKGDVDEALNIFREAEEKAERR